MSKVAAIAWREFPFASRYITEQDRSTRVAVVSYCQLCRLRGDEWRDSH